MAKKAKEITHIFNANEPFWVKHELVYPTHSQDQWVLFSDTHPGSGKPRLNYQGSNGYVEISKDQNPDNLENVSLTFGNLAFLKYEEYTDGQPKKVKDYASQALFKSRLDTNASLLLQLKWHLQDYLWLHKNDRHRGEIMDDLQGIVKKLLDRKAIDLTAIQETFDHIKTGNERDAVLTAHTMLNGTWQPK